MTRLFVLSGGSSDEAHVSVRTAMWMREHLPATVLAHDVRGQHACSPEQALDALSALGGALRDLVVINATHGGFGENGTLQGLLRARGVAHTHSGVMASAVCMNKHVCKTLLGAHGLITPRGNPVHASKITLQPPYVVKPVDGGSSTGVHVVRHARQMRALLDDGTYQAHDVVLAEEFVSGPEYTVGVMGTTALPPVQLHYDGDMYDAAGKYENAARRAVIDDGARGEMLRRMAEHVGHIVHARGCYRVDFRCDALGTPYVLEINTQPALGENATFSIAARASGLDDVAVTRWMVRDADPNRVRLS